MCDAVCSECHILMCSSSDAIVVTLALHCTYMQGKSKQAEVVILQKRRTAMEKELRALQSRRM